jgi:hypothetical protein
MLELREPLAPGKVSWRIARVVDDHGDKGKAQVLAYIDARDVMERLDYVCGIEGWQCRYSHTANKTVCDIGIKIEGEWVWKSDGAGDTDVEAEKGALSDAFKRAAVRWGIGRYLYDLGNNYAEVIKKGKAWYITPEAQKSLEKLLPSGGALKMADARTLDAKLRSDMAKQSHINDLKAFGQSIRDDVLKLPSYWQDEIRREYTERFSLVNRAAE